MSRPSVIRAALLLPLVLLAQCGRPDAPSAPQPEGATAAAALRPAASGLDRTRAGTPAPDLLLETGPDGGAETLADIRAAHPGQPVLVNLWATWCAPCVKELPTLDALAADTRGRLVVVPISQDMEGWRKVTPAWTWQHIDTRLESAMQFGFALGLRGLPATILYDPQGRELWRYLGDRDWNTEESRALIGLQPG